MVMWALMEVEIYCKTWLIFMAINVKDAYDSAKDVIQYSVFWTSAIS